MTLVRAFKRQYFVTSLHTMKKKIKEECNIICVVKMGVFALQNVIKEFAVGRLQNAFFAVE